MMQKSFVGILILYLLLFIVYVLTVSFVLDLQFALATSWFWLSACTAVIIPVTYLMLIRGKSTFGDRIMNKLGWQEFWAKPVMQQIVFLGTFVADYVVNIIFWPMFLLSAHGFNVSDRGALTDAAANQFKLRSRQFVLSSFVLAICISWQIFTLRGGTGRYLHIESVQAQLFLAGTALWLLLCIVKPVEIEARAFGSPASARLRMFIGCALSFAAFVAAMALVEIVVNNGTPNIQKIAVEVLFGGLFSTETAQLLAGLRGSLEALSAEPLIGSLTTIGLLQTLLVIVNFLFLWAILKKTSMPIIKAATFKRPEKESNDAALFLMKAGNYGEAEEFAAELPEGRVAPTLLQMCKLLRDEKFDELHRRSADLLVASAFERGKTIALGNLTDREKWLLLFLVMGEFLSLADHARFAFWSAERPFVKGTDLVMFLDSVRIRFGNEERSALLLILFARLDSDPLVRTPSFGKGFCAEFIRRAYVHDGTLSVSDFNEIYAAVSSQQPWGVAFFRSNMFKRHSSNDVDLTVMSKFAANQFIEEITTVNALVGFDGVDLFYLWSLIRSGKADLGEHFDDVIAVLRRFDSSGFLELYLDHLLKDDRVDTVLKDLLSQL